MHNHALFKRRLSTPSPTRETKRDGYQQQTRYSSELNSCRVCHDQASIVNYGALSCQSCKTFFRRNGLHPQNVPPCVYKTSCEMRKETRRYCTACRLAKCFSVGMCSDFIRKEEQRSRKHSLSSKSTTNTLARHNRLTPTSQFWMRDQSHKNRSLLSNSEQKIVFNVVHALQTYSATPKVSTIVKNELAMFFDLPFNKTNAIESIRCISTSMRSFLQSTPDFHILTINEKCSLFQRNFNGIVNLYSAIVFRDANVISNSHCIQSFVSIYGLEMMKELIRICIQLDLDSTVITLMLIILAFSSNCSIVSFEPELCKDDFLTGTYRLFGSQNVYVEALWKYMICLYGPYKSALRFAQLIKLSLDLIKYSANAYINNTTYHHLVNGINQEAKQLLIINENEQFHLWGRHYI